MTATVTVVFSYDDLNQPVAAPGGATGRRHLRMFTARAATSSTVIDDAADSISISNFAGRVSGIASVGLNAIAFVNEMYM